MSAYKFGVNLQLCMWNSSAIDQNTVADLRVIHQSAAYWVDDASPSSPSPIVSAVRLQCADDLLHSSCGAWVQTVCHRNL